MNSYYYKKAKKRDVRKLIRFFGLGMSLFGGGVTAYIFTPLILYQINSASVFASQDIHSPIPNATVIDPSNTRSNAIIETVDDTNAMTWFPTYTYPVIRSQEKPKIASYFISIPKIGVANAVVSTVDTNLAIHLVNYPGTAIPPDNGNAVTFGHSTLPSLFDSTNYKTILANAYKLSVGDTFLITVEGKTYTYDIYNITVVDPNNTSAFAQTYDNSYITLITCTPPGTTAQRLVIKSRLRNS